MIKVVIAWEGGNPSTAETYKALGKVAQTQLERGLDDSRFKVLFFEKAEEAESALERGDILVLNSSAMHDAARAIMKRRQRDRIHICVVSEIHVDANHPWIHSVSRQKLKTANDWVRMIEHYCNYR